MPTAALNHPRPTTFGRWWREQWAIALLVLVFALAVAPNLALRSFIWEEGRSAELARDILERGNLLEPSIYSERFVLKPSLLPWLIAGVARLTGAVDEWSARLPTMAAVLLTALMVFCFARRFASEKAALFGAGCFVFCPLVLRKLTISEPDTIVTALLFAALVVWWRVRTGAWRVIFCGLLLAVAAMAKGPQPVAYFGLGVGGYLLVRRRRGELLGLVFTLLFPAAAFLAWACAVYRPADLPVWLDYMHITPHDTVVSYLFTQARFAGILVIDLLPAILLAPFFWKARKRTATGEMRELWDMLIWYAAATTLVLLLWPGANTRYAMPAAPALAVMAGLVVDELWQERRLVARLATGLLGGLMVYQFALVFVFVPMFADRYGANRMAGATIARVVGEREPIFNVAGPNPNQLFYVGRPIRQISMEDALHLQPPAWLVLAPPFLEMIKARRPDYVFGESVRTPAGPGLMAIHLDGPKAKRESNEPSP